MAKLCLLRFLTVGQLGQAFDCWFRTEAGAAKAYDAAVKARAGAKPGATFLQHDITDDFGIRQSVNLVTSAIILTDTEKSALLNASVAHANQAAAAQINEMQKPGFKPFGSTTQ